MNVYIQLLQLTDFEFTPYFQCRISISRIVNYCGMHSHISGVENGYAEYLRNVPFSQCERMHRDGVITFANGNTLDGLTMNSTSVRNVILAGSVNSDGSCEGGKYSDPYGSWSKAYVQAIIKITLKSGIAPVKINADKITLKSGTVCKYSDGSCIDTEDGHTYWQATPSNGCNIQQYDVIYEGTAQKTTEGNAINAPEIYSLVTQDVTFALARTSEVRLCGYPLLKTEHPKLFIMETSPGQTLLTKKPIAVENLDIFTYVNSKFVYVERHIRTQVTSLYKDIMMQKCELERQVINNALDLAYLQPMEFAYTLMKGPGYMAVLGGEAIHLVKCIPVEVSVIPSDECYQELPVIFKNQTYFLHPKSHILKRLGTQRECNRILPVLYQIDEHWTRFLPKPLDAPAPIVLKPNTALTWKYLSPKKLAISGIYSQQDLENLREHILFPAEKQAMIHNVLQGMSGKQPLGGGMSIYNVLDEKTLEKITTNAAVKLWEDFVTFGSASAGILAIFVIFRLIKSIIDTIIHGYALHTAYGCGLHILGAIWSSITHLLLYSSKPGRTMDFPAEVAPDDSVSSAGVQSSPSSWIGVQHLNQIRFKSPAKV